MVEAWHTGPITDSTCTAEAGTPQRFQNGVPTDPNEVNRSEAEIADEGSPEGK
jgi:hypothetical protein